jgi:hypothetical protein
MKISEITGGMKTFTASVKVVVSGLGSVNSKTSVQADNITSARYMLARIYGKSNVISVKEVITEAGAAAHAKSPQDFQVKSLMDKSSQLKQQAKKVKSLQKLQAAQKNYSDVISTGQQSPEI